MVLLFAQTSYYVLSCPGKTAIVSRGVLLYDLQIIVEIVDWLALDGPFVDCGPFRTGSVTRISEILYVCHYLLMLLRNTIILKIRKL